MDMIDSTHIFFNNPATTREEALTFVAHEALNLGATNDESTLLHDLISREEQGSTGMMNGFALPHAKSTTVSQPCIVVVRFAQPLVWETMDKSSVSVLIALLIPDGDQGTQHLRILSKLAVMLMHEDVCAQIKTSDSPQEIVHIVHQGLEQ